MNDDPSNSQTKETAVNGVRGVGYWANAYGEKIGKDGNLSVGKEELEAKVKAMLEQEARDEAGRLRQEAEEVFAQEIKQDTGHRDERSDERKRLGVGMMRTQENLGRGEPHIQKAFSKLAGEVGGELQVVNKLDSAVSEAGQERGKRFGDFLTRAIEEKFGK